MSAEPSIVETSDYRKPRLVFVIASVSLVIGAVSAWLSRSDMNPDGISYLDLSDRFMAGDFRGIINGYWGPAYPALLSAVRFVMRPVSLLEFRAVHVANFIAFGLGLLTCAPFIIDGVAASVDRPMGLRSFPVVLDHTSNRGGRDARSAVVGADMADCIPGIESCG
jgi:hypothetical protein